MPDGHLCRPEDPRDGEEFALLEYFVRHADRVLSRDRIGEHVWDMNFDAGSNVIDVYVSALLVQDR